MGRFEVAADIEERVAAAVLRPQVEQTTAAIVADAKTTAPIDTGLLRSLLDAEPTVVDGVRVRGGASSTRPSDDGRTDVAIFVEFGTRYMTPRRYMAASTRRVISARGVGTFVEAADPWPHR